MRQQRLIGWLGLIPLLVGISTPAPAQLTPDTSLGDENSAIAPIDLSSDRIDGGAARGINLFHSFLDFNVAEGRGVYFSNPSGIDNIITRVTGNNTSEILGTLGVLGSANLFLLNPNGIIFGENASLDIEGSFFATTADRVQLGNDSYFSATDLTGSRLLTVQPGALFHNAVANQPAAITNAGHLAVGEGQTLKLQGGEVTSTGSLVAPGGRVEVLGDRISLLDQAQIDVSGETGGGIALIGGNFQGQGTTPTAQTTFVGPGVVIKADALNSGHGGTVIVWADDATAFYGTISARGANNPLATEPSNGGFVEVSGKVHLIYKGNVDTTAIYGDLGTLLLDPTNIEIRNGVGDGDDGPSSGNPAGQGSFGNDPAFGTNGQALAADIRPTILHESELEGMSGNTNLILQATNNINIRDLADNELNLAAGGGTIAFQADADGNGVGDFVMDDPNDTIRTNGRNIDITGANLSLGNIDTQKTPSVMVDVDSSGTIPLGLTVFTFTVPDFGGTITDLNLRLAIADHGFLNDLQISLESPSGTTLQLFNRTGGTSSDFNDILFDDAVGVNIAVGSVGGTPYRGVFQPSGPGGLAVFNGENTAGTWRLNINDFGLSGFDAGTVHRAGETPVWADPLLPATTLGTQLVFATTNATMGTNISGGDVNLTAQTGNLTVGSITTQGLGGMGNGGNVDLNAPLGNLTLSGDVTTGSTAQFGNGGGINLTAGGTVTTASLSSVVNDGNSGAIAVASTSGDINTSAGVLEVSSTWGNVADISLQAPGNITTGSINSLANNSDSGRIDITSTGGSIDTSAGIITSRSNAGNSSAIALQSPGSLRVGGIRSEGQLNGAIALDSNAGITVEGSVSGIANGNSGEGGAIALNTPQTVILKQTIETVTNGAAQGSQIDLSASSISAQGNGGLRSTTTGPGVGGKIEVDATDSIILTNGASLAANGSGSGNVGNLTAIARSLSLAGGAQISTHVAGAGNGGGLNLEVRDRVTLDNSTISSNVAASGTGQGSTIQIATQNLTLNNGSRLASNTDGGGNGGHVFVEATTLDLNSSQLVATSQGTGRAGNLNLKVSQTIRANNGQLTATSQQTGGGQINVNASEFQLENNSLISTEVYNSTDGSGNINIQAPTFTIRDNSDILTRATLGDGGSITINTPEFLLNLIARNQAFAVGQNPDRFSEFRDNDRVDISIPGLEGDVPVDELLQRLQRAIDNSFIEVDINALRAFLYSPDSQPLANNFEFLTDFFMALTKELFDPTVTLVQNSLYTLPDNFINTDDAIARSCIARRHQQRGSFQISGTGGLPYNPYEALRGQYNLTALQTIDTSVATPSNSPTPAPTQTWQLGDPVVEAQGLAIAPDGRVVLASSPQLLAMQRLEDLVCSRQATSPPNPNG